MLHLLIDFDGTICDSKEGVLKSAEYALKKFGIKLNLTQDQLEVMFLGPPLSIPFGTVFNTDEKKVALAIKYFRERYNVYGVIENKIYDGVFDCLNRLKKIGVKLYIASSKPIHFIETILGNNNMLELFDGIYAPGLDGEKLTKYDIVILAKEHAHKTDKAPDIYMVGDRKYDIEGAHQADLPCIGVKWGYADENELEEYKAEYIVENCDELLKLVVEISQNKEDK